MCLYHGQALQEMQEQSDMITGTKRQVKYDARQSTKILPPGRCGGDHLLRSSLREREREREREGERE